MATLSEYVAMKITWLATESSLLPYTAHVNGKTLLIRVNDFPEDPLYSLLVDNAVVGDLEAWPKDTWTIVEKK